MPDLGLLLRSMLLAALSIPTGVAAAQTTDPPADSPYVEAQRAEARGEYARAEELYSEAVAREPEASAPLLGRARMRSWLGHFDTAIEDYSAVVMREPQNAQAMSGLAWTYAWSRRYDDARRTFEQLAKAEPYYLDARKGLAYVELWRGNAPEARRQFEVLAREDQGNPDYTLAIAQAAYLQGDLAAAREAYGTTLRLKPDLEAARSGLAAVDAAAVERRPALTLLAGRSEAGDVEHSGLRFAQLAMQVRPTMRLWITHDRGVGFDGFSTDRRALDASTTMAGGFFNFTRRTGTRIEAGVRQLVDEDQPVLSAEQVFFLPGGTTPKIGVWAADGDAGTQWVVNAGVHKWLTSRISLEPTVYVGDDGNDQEIRGALLASYTTARRAQLGLGFAYGSKDTVGGSVSVDRIFANASVPLGRRATLMFYGWREGTEGFDDQTVLALGLTMHL